MNDLMAKDQLKFYQGMYEEFKTFIDMDMTDDEDEDEEEED